MKLDAAREKIKATVQDAIARCEASGLVAEGRSYFCDKDLMEVSEFNNQVILVFGAIQIGLPDTEPDERLTQSFCTEIKLGEVDEAALDADIKEFFLKLEKTLKRISESADRKAELKKIYEEAERDAAQAMQEFYSEVRKTKLKAYGALAVVILLILAVLIIGPMLK
jgi:hypothetical protein